jgi:flagellar P-ring protein precursor FlgI
VDGRVVRVRWPAKEDERVAFMADIENLPLTLATPAAKIVINARTGSVVMNQSVTLLPCAVAHGNLSVTISTTPVISQPNPLSQGSTVQAQKSDITIKQEPGALIQMPAGTKLSEVVKALSALGATPQDLLAILQAMKTAGALNAELEVI